MYSPALRPSSIRAAPAKKRIWSSDGGISSVRVSSIGLPVFWHSAAMTSSARSSIASANFSSARCRSDGVLSRHDSNALLAAAYAASTSSWADSGAVPNTSPEVGIDQIEATPVLGVDLLAVDEVRDAALVSHSTYATDAVARYQQRIPN